MNRIEKVMNAPRPYLTDGGMETWLFFQQGFTAPEFAAITLVENADAAQALQRYFEEFLAMAQAADTGFVLDTNTWRGAECWAEALGLTGAQLLRLNEKAVDFAARLKDRWAERVPDIVLNGVIGPVGDGYAPGKTPTIEDSRALHRSQIEVLQRSGVEMLSAMTITNVAEAIGIALEARDVGLPLTISFTVETDGRLPSGDLLGEAIEAVDAASGGYPLWYMINCAHPDHFRDAITAGEAWIDRIGGLRANASRLSHAELDNADALDDGNPEEFGALHAELATHLPNLRVVGGCCGTDHRHVQCVSRHLHSPQPA